MSETTPVYDYLGMNPVQIQGLSDKELLRAAAFAQERLAQHRKENSIMYYEPVSEEAWRVHQSTARVCGVSGGNRSGKSATVIAEICMLATGIMPARFRDDPVFRSKFRGPIQIRIVVESLINTLWPAILPKFQWFKWIGVGMPGGEKGHWGWIPKSCLIKGDWEKSFSKTERCLRILCRDPDNPSKILGESTIHFMSKDNDPEDFASGEFHIVMEDEPPTEPIHRENLTRVQSVNGRVMLAMTWPDDPTIPVRWLLDDVYEKGIPGPYKDPDIDWFELDARDNQHVLREGLEFNIRNMSKQMFDVRVLGKPMRLSNLVHPLFAEKPGTWCFNCNEPCNIVIDGSHQHCQSCGNENVVTFSHVIDEDPKPSYPVVCLLDPHPRKPHMLAWIAVTPDDEYHQIAEAELDTTPGEVHRAVLDIEREHRMLICKRLMDPNMGLSAPGVNRSVTWQDEFADVGLRFDLADDSSVGQSRINELMRPDPDTLRPRFYVNRRCRSTIKQFGRYQWDNYKMGAERGTKETAKTVDDDFPTLWKYLVNYEPSFRFLQQGAPVLNQRRGRRG